MFFPHFVDKGGGVGQCGYGMLYVVGLLKCSFGLLYAYVGNNNVGQDTIGQGTVSYYNQRKYRPRHSRPTIKRFIVNSLKIPRSFNHIYLD